MGEIFVVELSNRKGQYYKLTLPATDYKLLDALEQLHMDPGENPKWEIIGIPSSSSSMPSWTMSAACMSSMRSPAG